ncbi:PEP-CTERM sorting domain-containing protein [Pseudomonadota bacterium]
MKTKLFALALAGALSTSGAMAATYSFGGTGPLDADGGAVNTVGDVLDMIAVDNDSSVRYDDYMSDGSDSYWAVTGSGGSSSTMIIELAGFAGSNEFGVYNRQAPHERVELFAGADSAGDQAHLSIKADGSVHVNFSDTGVDFGSNAFGFYLDSSASVGGGIWYSDSSMNVDGKDHMAAYQGDDSEVVEVGGNAAGLWTDNEFVLAFEDLNCNTGCDGDMTDFMVMVESVNPVSTPGSLALLGLGLGLLGATARRKAKRA